MPRLKKPHISLSLHLSVCISAMEITDTTATTTCLQSVFIRNEVKAESQPAVDWHGFLQRYVSLYCISSFYLTHVSRLYSAKLNMYLLQSFLSDQMKWVSWADWATWLLKTKNMWSDLWSIWMKSTFLVELLTRNDITALHALLGKNNT